MKLNHNEQPLPSTSGDHWNDLRLASAAARGDESARRELVTGLVTPIRRVLSFLADCDATAEDLTQVTLVQVLSAIGTYRGECALEHWAKRIAIHISAKHHKKRRRRQGIREKTWHPENPDIGVDERADLRRLRVRVRSHLLKLSPKLRGALVLHIVEGYTAAEVSDITGVPFGTVRDRLTRGRAKLKKMIIADPAISDWFKGRDR